MTTPLSETPQNTLNDDERELGPHGQNSAVAWTRRTSTRVGVGLRPPQTFLALRHRNFRLYWVGGLVSLIGTWMQIVAQGWLVYKLTGSSALLGLVTFVGSMPTFIISVPAGVWVDLYPKRTILLVTQTLSMVLAFALAGLVMTNTVAVWHILVLSALQGVVNAIDAPARHTIVPELTTRDEMMNAIALNTIAFNGARVIGPAVAGILVGITGEGLAFFINGVSFMAVIIALIMIHLPARTTATARPPLWQTAAEGLNYIRVHPTILALISMMAVTSLFGLSYNTLMPVLAGEVLGVGATGYGLMMSAIGVGAVLGGFSLATLGNFRAKGALLTTGSLLFPFTLFIIAGSQWIPLVVVALLVAGWASVSHAVLTNALLQSSVPDELRGRVMSIYQLVFFGFFPLGSLWAGYLAEHVGAPAAIAIGAVISLAYAIFIFIRAPRVRALE